MNQPRAVTEEEGGLVCKGDKKGMEGREPLLLGVGMCTGVEGKADRTAGKERDSSLTLIWSTEHPKHPGMPLVRPPGRHGPDDPAGWELSSSSLSPSTCSFSGTHHKRDPRLASGILGWSLL